MDINEAQIISELDSMLETVEAAMMVSPHSASPAAPPDVRLDDDGIIPVAPESQIRGVAILYAKHQYDACIDLMSLLDQVALDVSKRPFFLRKVLFEEFSKGRELSDLIKKAAKANAMAAIVLLPTAGARLGKSLQKIFSTNDFICRCLSADQAADRQRATGLIFDLMLARPQVDT